MEKSSSKNDDPRNPDVRGPVRIVLSVCDYDYDSFYDLPDRFLCTTDAPTTPPGPHSSVVSAGTNNPRPLYCVESPDV